VVSGKLLNANSQSFQLITAETSHRPKVTGRHFKKPMQYPATHGQRRGLLVRGFLFRGPGGGRTREPVLAVEPRSQIDQLASLRAKRQKARPLLEPDKLVLGYLEQLPTDWAGQLHTDK
jgi:hypothetical protein